MLSEEELIAAIKARTKAGAEALYDRYAPMIYKVICCYTAEEEFAEQVFENVFRKIWGSFDEFNEQPCGLSLWILKNARAFSKIPYTETITINKSDSENDGLEFAINPV